MMEKNIYDMFDNYGPEVMDPKLVEDARRLKNTKLDMTNLEEDFANFLDDLDAFEDQVKQLDECYIFTLEMDGIDFDVKKDDK